MTCMTSAWGALHSWPRFAQGDIWWAISDGVGHGISQLQVGVGEGPGETKCTTIPLRNLGQSCWPPLWEPRISWQTNHHARWSHPSHSQDITRVPIRCCYRRAALTKHESRTQSHQTNLGLHQMSTECDGSPSRQPAGSLEGTSGHLARSATATYPALGSELQAVCACNDRRQWGKHGLLSDARRYIIMF